MTRRRDLIFANLAALLLLIVVLLLGWWQEAAFGLAVLLFLDLFVFLRGRQAQSDGTPTDAPHFEGGCSDGARSTGEVDGEGERPEPGEGADPG